MKKGTKIEQEAALNLEKDANSKPQSLNVYGAPTVTQESLNLYGPSEANTGQKLLTSIEAEIKRKGISDQVFGRAVADFKSAVDKFKGETGIKEVTTNYNPQRRSDVNPSNRELADVISGEGLKEKDIFTYQGKTYEVKKDLLRRLYGAQKKAMGGQVRNYEMGSFGGVRGPGTATSDSIPAMLSNGEYVLRASAVDAIGVPMLDQINKMAMGGLATRYNVSKQMSMPSNTMGYNKGGPIHYYNVGGLAVNAADGQSPIEIARMTMAMMNSVSTNQAKAVGPSKLVGRGYLA
jgi:hypothetical protein